jgi:NADH-quinone oxidoreductase subunit K
VIRPALPYLLVAVLAGCGVYGILARRHAVLVLVGVELLLGAAGLLLVTVGQTAGTDLHASAPVLTLFVITIAAAEVVVALAVLLALYRARGHVDLHADLDPRAPSPRARLGEQEAGA